MSIVHDETNCRNPKCDYQFATLYDDGEVQIVSCDECCFALHVWLPINSYQEEMLRGAYPDGFTCDHCGDEFQGYVPFLPKCCGLVCGYCASSQEFKDTHEDCDCIPVNPIPELQSLQDMQY